MVPTFIRYQPLVCLPASGAAACTGTVAMGVAATAAAVPARSVLRLSLSSVMASPLFFVAASLNKQRGNRLEV
jgi:hypothetical protein